MGPIGSRLLTRPAPAVSPEMLRQFATVGTSQVSDCMNRMYGAVGLRPLHGSGARMAGIALTVKTRPADNLTIHKALGLAGPGDVLVVDGGGDLNTALVGELMMTRARMLDVAGFVIDGAVRDAELLAQGDFPCFARGVALRGPYKDGPGEINVPVSIGGQVVMAGDVVLGDADGVVFVPAAHAQEILTLALQKDQDEATARATILAGDGSDNSWLDTLVAKKTGSA